MTLPDRDKRYDQLHASRAHYIRCFNRLEKAVTNHIQGCIDSGDLEHAHQAVMRDLIAGAPEVACDFCGQTEGHSKRCGVTKFGVNPKPPYTDAVRSGPTDPNRTKDEDAPNDCSRTKSGDR